MSRRKKTRKVLPDRRNRSLEAVPVKLPAVREEVKDGKLYVTIAYERPRWQRFLGADRLCERSYGLDDYGRHVYESCDGDRTVKQLVWKFAKRTKISKPEAEMAVTKFLKTLISKGLVAVEMEKP